MYRKMKRLAQLAVWSCAITAAAILYVRRARRAQKIPNSPSSST